MSIAYTAWSSITRIPNCTACHKPKSNLDKTTMSIHCRLIEHGWIKDDYILIYRRVVYINNIMVKLKLDVNIDYHTFKLQIQYHKNDNGWTSTSVRHFEFDNLNEINDKILIVFPNWDIQINPLNLV